MPQVLWSEFLSSKGVGFDKVTAERLGAMMHGQSLGQAMEVDLAHAPQHLSEEQRQAIEQAFLDAPLSKSDCDRWERMRFSLWKAMAHVNECLEVMDGRNPVVSLLATIELGQNPRARGNTSRAIPLGGIKQLHGRWPSQEEKKANTQGNPTHQLSPQSRRGELTALPDHADANVRADKFG